MFRLSGQRNAIEYSWQVRIELKYTDRLVDSVHIWWKCVWIFQFDSDGQIYLAWFIDDCVIWPSIYVYRNFDGMDSTAQIWYDNVISLFVRTVWDAYMIWQSERVLWKSFVNHCIFCVFVFCIELIDDRISTHSSVILAQQSK